MKLVSQMNQINTHESKIACNNFIFLFYQYGASFRNPGHNCIKIIKVTYCRLRLIIYLMTRITEGNGQS